MWEHKLVIFMSNGKSTQAQSLYCLWIKFFIIEILYTSFYTNYFEKYNKIFKNKIKLAYTLIKKIY